MIKWIAKIDLKKVLLASLAYTIVAMIIRQIEAVLTMRYYLMPEYFGVWSQVMMPTAGPPPPSFFTTSTSFAPGLLNVDS